jgi:hypothetical protein
MRLAIATAGAILFVAVATHAAHAADTVTMTTRAAVHDARVTRDGITWRSIYVDNAAIADKRQAIRLELARPIDATLDVAGSPGVTPIVSDESIVAFVIDADRLPYWNDAVAVTLHAPRSDAGKHEEVLEAPLAHGDVPQRIVVSGDDDLRFEPDEPTLERHVGYWAPASSRESERRACDEAIGSRAPLPLDDLPIYVAGVDGAATIRGHFTTGPERARPGVIAATLLFVLVAALLAIAHRVLSGRARIEQAEAILREEFGGEWRTP